MSAGSHPQPHTWLALQDQTDDIYMCKICREICFCISSTLMKILIVFLHKYQYSDRNYLKFLQITLYKKKWNKIFTYNFN